MASGSNTGQCRFVGPVLGQSSVVCVLWTPRWCSYMRSGLQAGNKPGAGGLPPRRPCTLLPSLPSDLPTALPVSPEDPDASVCPQRPFLQPRGPAGGPALWHLQNQKSLLCKRLPPLRPHLAHRTADLSLLLGHLRKDPFIPRLLRFQSF